MANDPVITPSTGGSQGAAQPLAIGSPIAGAAPGSMLFVDTSGNLAHDNANLSYDATNKRSNQKEMVIPNKVTIGSTTPGGAIFNIGDAGISGVYPVVRAATGSQILWTYNSGGTDIWVVGKNLDDTWIFLAPNGIGHTLILSPSTGALSMNKGGIADASALLDMTSTAKGFLPPRMTTTQKNAIGSPAEGLCVYDTTLHKLCVRTASAWETVTSS